MSYAALFDPNRVPQTEALDARQVRNNAGGFTYALDMWARLDRFLVLGSDQGSYYQTARKMTRENARSVMECWSADANRTADRIAEISSGGRAPKNSPAIFALALGDLHDTLEARQAARRVLGRVCRTSTHLFEYVSTLDALGRGWGRGLKRAVSNWYESKGADKLGLQMVKYRSRHDFDHGRLVKCSHPSAKDGDAARKALYAWACGREVNVSELPDIVQGHLSAMKAETARDLIPLIERHRLPWEAIPTWALRDADVWKAMLPGMGMTALVRNLGTLTELDVLKPLSGELRAVTERLRSQDELRMGMIHPFTLLNALANYRAGKGLKGSRTWTPVRDVTDALDDAFYLAFENVVPTGKRHLLALDVSGSMGSNFIANSRLSAREAAGAMAMVTAKSEPWFHTVGFTSQLVDLDVSPRMRLDKVVRNIQRANFGSTDCSKPMVEALRKGWEVDVFVVYTDNETYVGSVHPSQALRKYRKETGIDAKLIVVGMTSTGFSIADPNDGGMLDVVGFDDSAPALMADFARG